MIISTSSSIKRFFLALQSDNKNSLHCPFNTLFTAKRFKLFSRCNLFPSRPFKAKNNYNQFHCTKYNSFQQKLKTSIANVCLLDFQNVIKSSYYPIALSWWRVRLNFKNIVLEGKSLLSGFSNRRRHRFITLWKLQSFSMHAVCYEIGQQHWSFYNQYGF